MQGNIKPSLENEIKLESEYVMHTYGRKNVEFVEGHGMVLVDDEGKEYLDFLAGIAVLSLGHSHPKIVETIQNQASRLMQTSNYFYADGRGELAKMISELICERSNTSLDWIYGLGGLEGQSQYMTFFANSGAEANEGAFKLARRYSEITGSKAKTILFMSGSFHGRTLATIAATGQSSKQEYFKPLPDGFLQIDFNDPDDFLKALDTKNNGGVCAVVLECVQGESGIWPCDQEYLRMIRSETSKRGIALIVDEVQTGFYRCGEYPFAFQHYGIVPDIITMAKGIAGGFPCGAFAASKEVAKAFQPGDHGSTFGGNPLAIAAAKATIQEMKDSTIGKNSAEVGAYLKKKLSGMPLISEVRGFGLMLGAELDKDIASQVVDRALESGLVINAPKANILRFVPPLICTKDDVDKMILILQPILSSFE